MYERAWERQDVRGARSKAICQARVRQFARPEARQFARPEAAVGARSACGQRQQSSASFSSLPTTTRLKLRITTHFSSLFLLFF